MPEITKISHSLTIGDLKFGNARPGIVEATLKPGETMEQALDELDERLNAWHRKRYPHLYQESEPVKQFIPIYPGGTVAAPNLVPPVIEYEKEPSADILSAIQSTTTLEELKTFKTIAGSPGNEELYKAYNDRVKSLMK